MNKKIAVLTIAILVTAGLGFGTYTLTNSDTKKTVTNTETKNIKPVPKARPTTNTIQYQGVEGKTALELLQTTNEAIISGTGENAYVTSINDIAANASNEYWAFYVNDTLASVGAGSYITKSTDIIKWELTKF